MARQDILLGASPTGVGGDTPRSANTKVNNMMSEIYANLGNLKSGAFAAVLGSVASGSIVEFGGGSPNFYVRLAGGVQICWGYSVLTVSITSQDGPSGTGPALYYGAANIGFPAAFLGGTYPSCFSSYTLSGTLTWTCPLSDSTPGGFNHYVMSNKANNRAGTFYWLAVGRWQ